MYKNNVSSENILSKLIYMLESVSPGELKAFISFRLLV